MASSRTECAKYLSPGSYLELPSGFDPTSYEIRPSPVTHRLRHQETIDLGGRKLTVHHTPGHSPGSICLLDSRDDLLFTGDAFYPGMMYGHFEDSDFDVYQQSIDYMVGLLPQVSHLCPAHNEAYVPKEVLQRVQEAFASIVSDQAPYDLDDGARVYRFEGFGLMLP